MQKPQSHTHPFGGRLSLSAAGLAGLLLLAFCYVGWQTVYRDCFGWFTEEGKLRYAARCLGSYDHHRASRAIVSLHKAGPVAVPYLMEALHDRRPSARSDAALVLACFGARSSEALPLLRELAVNDPGKSVRNFALVAVEAIEKDLKKQSSAIQAKRPDDVPLLIPKE